MEKITVLANYLGVKVEQISGVTYDDSIFTFGNREYMVLTDDEANEKAYEYIADSLWTFNPNFIISHSSVLDFDRPSELIVKAIQGQYESGNEAIKKLIDDLDEFVEDAINSDGRGHLIGLYDGCEDEYGGYYIYRIN